MMDSDSKIESETRQIFGIDDSLTSKKSRPKRGCCCRCVKCLLSLLLALVLALAVAAIVFIGVYYKFEFDKTTDALEDRIAVLEAMLNQTEPAASVVSLQQAMMQTNDLKDKVEAVNETIMDLQTQMGQRTADITEAISDVNDSLIDTQDLVTQTKADLTLNIDQVSQNQRAVYVRWGSSSCPDVNGTSMVYSGTVGGASINHQGGGSNHLCMPLDPEYNLPIQTGIQGFSAIYPAEYETGFLSSSNRNVPCAVCSVSTRTQALMIPAKTTCPPGWTREYFGYLLAEGYLNRRSTFICTDVSHEGVPSADGNTEANDLWQVEAQCSVLSCPPYNPEGEIQCAVCSR